jgi:hypothetical protein
MQKNIDLFVFLKNFMYLYGVNVEYGVFQNRI